MAQQTLEDAAEKYFNSHHDKKINDIWRSGVQFGAKWQQERMYSEEEVCDLFAQWAAYQKGFPRVDEDEIPNGFMSFNQWFEQHKK